MACSRHRAICQVGSPHQVEACSNGRRSNKKRQSRRSATCLAVSSYSSGWQADAASKSILRPSCSAVAHQKGCRRWSGTQLSAEPLTCGQRQQHGKSHLLDSKVSFAGCAFACIRPATPPDGIKRGAACSRQLDGQDKPCLSKPQAGPRQDSRTCFELTHLSAPRQSRSSWARRSAHS